MSHFFSGAILVCSLTIWWFTTGGILTHLRRHFFDNRVPEPAIPLQPVHDAAPVDGGAWTWQPDQGVANYLSNCSNRNNLSTKIPNDWLYLVLYGRLFSLCFWLFLKLGTKTEKMHFPGLKQSSIFSCSLPVMVFMVVRHFF